MHFLLLYEVADDYIERRGAFRADHLGMAQQAFDSGELVLAGALAEPPDGAVFVFRQEDAATRFAEGDPYVKNGLVKSWRIRKWTTVLGDGATPPKL